MGYLNEIFDYIKSGETKESNLGLEIEHFIINDEGVQIGFHEISPLIERIGNETGSKLVFMDGYPVGYANDRYSVSLEPSCQFEISINPFHELSVIEKVYEEFRALWDPVFEERGYHFETKGNLPLVETGRITPDDIPLSPKKRYIYMDAYFKKSGKYGKYMMRSSASTQVSVDFRSEEDLVKKLRVLQKISPLLMIMMESKVREDSSLPGVEGKPHLLRIQEWDDLDPARTGFFPGSFDDDFGYEKAAQVVYDTPLILLTDNGRTVDVGNKSAKDLVNEGTVPEDLQDEERKVRLIEHFLSMGFFHFRIKKYIEIRVADSVPVKKALGYVALLKGLVYSDENLDILEKELAGTDSIDAIQDAVLKIEADGMDAVIYDGLTAAGWSEKLKKLAGSVLSEDEKKYLEYL